MAAIKRISTNFWFDREAEEAAKFYTQIFKNSAIGRIAHYGKEGHEIHKMPEGFVLTVEFELDGSQFVALNGGPSFKFNEAISLVVNCESQAEVDYYWSKLSEGGDPDAQQCGWLKDRFGVSWQVVPVQMSEWFSSKNKVKTERLMKAMLQMKKLDLAKLREAFEG